MHEQHPIEFSLKEKAEEISKELNGASVVIIAAGSAQRGLHRTMTASCMAPEDQRLRDLLGILQVAAQLESLKHLDLLTLN